MTKEEIAGLEKHKLFKAVDELIAPHPYCITDKHVAYAADHCAGRLGKEAIEQAEQRGIHCGVKGCALSYEEHVPVLVIAVNSETEEEASKHEKELRAYLQKLVDDNKDKIKGFTFMLSPESFKED